MNIPANLKYTKDHEWVKVEGDSLVVGITDHAQGELGDVVYVDLPSVGKSFSKEESLGSIEAVKAVADIFCPVGGEIIAVNEALLDAPDTVNKDPYGAGWMVKIKAADSSEINKLMTPEAYKEHIS
jgi:glycine cleavage system H protein